MSDRLSAAEIAQHLPKAKQSGDGWSACCPAHEDSNPSLSIADGTKGVVFRCHRGCSQEAVISALQQRGLWAAPTNGNGAPSAPPPKTPWHQPRGRPSLKGQPPDHTYEYVYADGTLAFWIHRWDNLAGKKTIRPQLPDGTMQAAPAGRPPYLLSRIAENPDLPVLIVEGEKAADAAALLYPSLGVTTSAGGSNAVEKTDWTWAAGRTVIAWPDHDAVGAKYAEQVEARCLQAGATQFLTYAYPDDIAFSDGWDIADPCPPGYTLPTADELLIETGENRAILDKLKSPADFRANPPASATWIVNQMVSDGTLSIWGGKPGAGKSTLLRDVGAAVASGRRWMGRDVRQGPVVLLALEELERHVWEHLERMGIEDAPFLSYVEPAPKEALAALETVIAHVKPVMVIIDPLAMFVSVEEFNDYKSYDQMMPLKHLARATGVHIALVHHARKGEVGYDSLLGSTAFMAAVDAALILDMDDEGRRFLSTIKMREGESIPPAQALRLTVGLETGRLMLDGTRAELGAPGRWQSAIQEAIENAEESLTAAEIAKAVCCSDKNVRKFLKTMVREGYIREDSTEKTFRYLPSAPSAPKCSGADGGTDS